MVRLLAVLVLAGASVNAQTITQNFGSGANSFSMEFVTIGSPGNNPDGNSFGKVDYSYKIGKYEVSQNQIDKATANGLFGMQIPASSYGANQPAAFLSWFQAAAFVNWLNSSSGFQAAYNLNWSGSTYSMSLWNASEAWQRGGQNLFRHKDAHYFLPNENEWYKAAFFNPAQGNYSLYPTKSDFMPLPVALGNSEGTAVYSPDPSINQFLSPPPTDQAGGESFFGTMGQGGSMVERLETAFDANNDNPLENRSARGGSFFQGADLLQSSSREQHTPESQYWSLGFRVAGIPEPSSLSLLLAGGAVLVAGRRRKA